MVVVHLQYKDPPRLKVIEEPTRLMIMGMWDTDWGFKKFDTERFFIERQPAYLLVWGKAHYGIEVTKQKIQGNEVTLLFKGQSHAPVGIWEGHHSAPSGYAERGFIFKFAPQPTHIYFHKLKASP